MTERTTTGGLREGVPEGDRDPAQEGALPEEGLGRSPAGGPGEGPENGGKEARISATNTARWIGVGLLGLPLYGALTFWSSLDPQPDPGAHYEAWSRFVTTDQYVLSHLFGSILGLILAIFGTFALGAHLAGGRSGRMGLIAMVVAVLGTALFLPAMGVSAFAAPAEGQAYLAGIEGFSELPSSFADGVFAAASLVTIVLLFVGNVLLGVAVWSSGTLPKMSGALWAGAAVLMYPLGIVYAAMIGVQSTPPTVLVGAALLVIGGGWMAFRAMRRPSEAAVSTQARPSAR